jgi:class 3 adenylate cyclase
MFNQQPIHITWYWQLKATPEKLWPFISDTNRLFKDIKQPSIQPAHITNDVDPCLIQLSYNGINRYEVWEEKPYEWEYPFRFGVKRHYESGPYKDLKIQVDLHPNPNGTRIQFKLWAEPRLNILSLLTTLKLKTLIKKRIKNTIYHYDAIASRDEKMYQNSKEKRLVRGGEKRLKQIQETLYNSDINAEVLEKLIKFIRQADDLELKRIRPYELADHWEIPRKKVFEVFVHAAKADLLNFNWDLHCPHCRSIQHSVKTLNQIHEPIYCDECEEEFNVNFNKTIQLSFTPNPLVRKIDRKQYCVRGPQSKSHILIQQYLEPGETRFLKTNLTPGTYILRTNQSKGKATVHVDNSGSDTVHVKLFPSGLSGEKVSIIEDPNLSLENSSTKRQLITLEKKSWDNTTVSAAQATSTQLFRNLFANEVLKKGEKISVDHLTFMFTDLFDSTGMYNKEGDDKAVGQVINHFEILQKAIADENGAIVKTIGDSVMAVFCKPDQALKAYLRAQEMLSRDEKVTDNLQLKAGIHHGSCVAANLNSRIDYFGSTVNIASHFVDYASENEVIISQNTITDIDLDYILEKYKNRSTVKNISTQLKGFERESFSIKRVKIDSTTLRLAV